MRILVTRPAADAELTAARLMELGHEAVLSPVSRLHVLRPVLALALQPDALIVTSRNAIRALDGHAQRAELLNVPLLAVGRSTAELAQARGFASVVAAAGTASSLIELAVTSLSKGKSALYLAGRDRAADVAGALNNHGIATDTVIIYEAIAEDGLTALAAERMANGDLDAVLHYSARGASLFLEHVRSSSACEIAARACAHLCLSAKVATALKPLGAETVLTAHQPDEDSLMDLLPSLARLNRHE